MQHLERPDRSIHSRIPVSRIPRELLQVPQAQWVDIANGRWKWEDAIILGEGRAVVRLLDGVSVLPGTRGLFIASMEDNEPFAMAAAKGRSSATSVNYLLRRLGDVSCAMDARMLLPWVDTANQTADDSSRLR